MAEIQPDPPSLPRDPICLALVPASSIIIDPSTGAVHLQGVYTQFACADFPITLNTIEVYVVLTEGSGSVLVELRLIPLIEESSTPTFSEFASVVFGDPFDVRQLVFRHFHPVIPSDGEYAFQLFAYPDVTAVNRSSTPFAEHRILISRS